MQRTTGTGFIGFGLVLIVAGATLKFAVTADANGFDIEAAGLIGSGSASCRCCSASCSW